MSDGGPEIKYGGKALQKAFNSFGGESNDPTAAILMKLEAIEARLQAIEYTLGKIEIAGNSLLDLVG